MTGSTVMNRIKSWPAWMLMGLMVVVLLTIGATRDGGPLTQSERIDAISQRLACPTCNGESVYVSRAAAAESIRNQVARDVAAGTTSASADNRNALLMADLGSKVVAGAGSADGLLLDLASRLGQNAVSTEQMARVASTTLSTADDQRQSGMGVNLDEELADLTRYQRAYEASARVMQIADEMLDRIINMTGR